MMETFVVSFQWKNKRKNKINTKKDKIYFMHENINKAVGELTLNEQVEYLSI